MWLLPDKSLEPFLRNTIRECSEIFNAPLFDPHITLGRVPDEKLGLVSQFITEIAEKFNPVVLNTQDLQCREEPYQKLVLTLQSEKNYHELCDTFDEFFEGNHSKREDPHISLFYSYTGCDTIKNKIETIRGNIPNIVESLEIAIVELRGQPAEWNIVERIKFRDCR